MTEGKHARRIPWILWPFWALWKLIAGIVTATGRLVAVILGLVFLILGVVLTVTVVTAMTITVTLRIARKRRPGAANRPRISPQIYAPT